MAAVWGIFAVVALEILITYSRLPPAELYNVSGSGVTGGASRALVFLNYPLALVAIPLLVLVAERLASRPTTVVAAVGLVLSAAIFWPGIVEQSDLDARPVNAIAALGVLTAASLTAFAVVRLGMGWIRFRSPGDWLRVALAAVALAVAIPWIAADVGVYLTDAPVLGTIFQTGELTSQPNVAGVHPAVHHGHHHGMDGVLLVLSALLLSRLLPAVRRRWLGAVCGAYLSLMLSYGAANAANDAWLEQVVKRGWTDWQIPNVTEPKLSAAWAIVVACAVALFAASAWRASRVRWSAER